MYQNLLEIYHSYVNDGLHPLPCRIINRYEPDVQILLKYRALKNRANVHVATGDKIIHVQEFD